MYIYYFLKFILVFIGSFLKKDIKKGFILFEFIIILIYLLLFFFDYININIYLLIWFLFWLLIILFYKIIYYLYLNYSILLNNLEQIVNEKQKKKIKNFFLNPMVSKIIYYLIWMLPWNIIYWIYFWIQENGWYARVWFSSTRDIIFWKMFKWDSRIFFYNLFEKINENKVIKLIYQIKEQIVKAILRLLLIVSFFRKNFLEIPTLAFINSRIIVFCYLSIFYFYIVHNIFIINVWIFWFIIFIELIFLLFFDKFVIFILKIDEQKKNNNNFFILLKLISQDNLWLLYDPLDLKYYEPAKIIFETNNMVWNKILGNSVSLNILYEYILFVNKNTKGYFFYNYEIMTKMRNIKLVNVNNIPWTILPQSRYVIMWMKYVQWNVNNDILFNNLKTNEDYYVYNNINNKLQSILKQVPDYRIKSKKNLYLSLYEKTYYDNTLLFTIYMLLLNYDTLFTFLYDNYNNHLLYNYKIDKNFFIFDSKLSDLIWLKTQLWKLKLLEINKNNPEFLNIIYVLHLFEYNERLLDLSVDYFIRLELFNIKLPTLKKDQKIINIKNYKDNIKLLSHFFVFNEECITWNDDLLQYFDCIEKEKLNINYNIPLINLKNVFSKFMECNKQSWRFDDQQALKKSLIEDFGVVFNKDFKLDKFNDFNIINLSNLFDKNIKIDDINYQYLKEKTILEECLNIMKDLENIKFNELNLFELRWDNNELRIVWDEDIINKNYNIFIKNVNKKK